LILKTFQVQHQVSEVVLHKMTPPLATVGILSLGDMGINVAKLLIAKNYKVVTNLEGRRYGRYLYLSLFNVVVQSFSIQISFRPMFVLASSRRVTI